MNASLTWTTRSAEETQQLGRLLGSLIQIGDVFLLQGTLGTGKTTLTQGVAWGVGVDGYAHSPTFVIVHEYEGRIPIYHLDLYRIGDALEAEDLAVDEMLERGACLVEWPERAAGAFPGEHLLVAIEFGGDPDTRIITLTPFGERYDRITESLRTAASAPTGTN